MELTAGFLSGKIPGRGKLTALLSIELKIHIFVFALLLVCLEVQSFRTPEEETFDVGIMAIAFMSFFLLGGALGYAFRAVAGKVGAEFFAVLPMLLIYFLIKESDAAIFPAEIILFSAGVRIAIFLIPWKQYAIIMGTILTDGAVLLLRFLGGMFTGEDDYQTLMFACLTVLTLSALQHIVFARKEEPFPFSYFLILGILLAGIPASKEPIDWQVVVRAGERVAEGVSDAFGTVTYYLSENLGFGTYTAGYSSLDVNGGDVVSTERTQLILETTDKPYVLYKDPSTETLMMRRRTVYLAGGKGADPQNLISFISFLHDLGISPEYAKVFSQKMKMQLEYGYLKTTDEIAPVGTFMLSDKNGAVSGGTSEKVHKKGYTLNASYLDIDYGSPYLISLMRQAGTGKGVGALTYDEADMYLRELCNTRIEEVISEDAFLEVMTEIGEYGLSEVPDDTGSKENDATVVADKNFLATEGASDRMEELSHTLTDALDNDYDKCRAVEEYLRRYTYSTKSGAGADRNGNMNTSEGLSGIADRFLFETGQGYCVHYSSAMVMLLRLSGIPARVVTGYRYVFPFEVSDNYKVSSILAHAWPEAYIRGVGWVPFEPTTVYLSATDRNWMREPAPELMAELSGEITENAELEQQLGEYPGISIGTGDGYTGYMQSSDYEDYLKNLNLPDTDDIAAETEEDSLHSLKDMLLGVVLPVILSVMLLFAVLLLGVVVIRIIRYRHATPAEKLMMDTEQIKKQIRKLSKADFVDRGFMSDYMPYVPGELKADAERVFASYYRIIYGAAGGFAVSEEDGIVARALREKLAGILRRKMRHTRKK